ncbi:MAG: dihydropteroate synthase [Lewinella sp.]|nr:dihydropteroate synthase [Lewinella sp.]
MLFPQKTINCGGRLLTLETPRIMGIINVTPDSFYAGSRRRELAAIVATAGDMLAAGADILDIGGMSSRPGAELISVPEELERVIPAIEAILATHPEALISVDTVRAEVARQAVSTGAVMINDISAGRIDPVMYDTAAGLRVPYILMHMRGTPADMQRQAEYEDVSLAVLDFLAAELAILREKGVSDVIADPGFGFGKTIDHNYQLLDKLHTLQILEIPILAGLSRKSMIYRVLGKEPADALNGTTALHMLALEQGARLLRVHDVGPAREVIQLWERLQANRTQTADH